MNHTPLPTSQNPAEVSTPPILRILLLRVFGLFFLDLVLNSKSPNPLYLPRTRLSSSCSRKQRMPSAKTRLPCEAHGGDVMTRPIPGGFQRLQRSGTRVGTCAHVLPMLTRPLRTGHSLSHPCFVPSPVWGLTQREYHTHTCVMSDCFRQAGRAPLCLNKRCSTPLSTRAALPYVHISNGRSFLASRDRASPGPSLEPTFLLQRMGPQRKTTNAVQ